MELNWNFEMGGMGYNPKYILHGIGGWGGGGGGGWCGYFWEHHIICDICFSDLFFFCHSLYLTGYELIIEGVQGIMPY